MRVCMVSGSFPAMDCGVGDYTWQLARHLAGAIEVAVVTSDRPLIRRFLADGIRKAGEVLDVRPAIRDWGVRSLPALCRAVRACRPDVVHIQYGAAAFDLGAAVNWLARALKWLGCRVPVVTTLHDPSGPRLFPRAGRLRSALVRLLCRDSDAVCTPDRLVRVWVAADRRVRRLYQLPVGVNILPVRAVSIESQIVRLRREHPAIFDGDPVLLTFGTLHPDRDYETMIEALGRISDFGFRISDFGSTNDGRAPLVVGRSSLSVSKSEIRNPKSEITGRVHWVLVGGAGRGADLRRTRELGELAARHGLADRVHMVGYAPPEVVSAWMAAADLCVLMLAHGATDARGSLLAALAHGKPTIVCGPGVYSEHLRDGEHLLWTPNGDPERLTAAVAALLCDGGARDRLGRAAAAVIERSYSWPRIAAGTQAIYAELLGSPREALGLRR